MAQEVMLALWIWISPWLGLAPPATTPGLNAQAAPVCESDCGELGPGIDLNGLRPGLDPNGLTGGDTSTCEPTGNCGELRPGISPNG